MIEVHLDKAEDMGQFLEENSLQITNNTVASIAKTYTTRKKSIVVFEVTISDAGAVYEVSLPRAEWERYLKSSTDYYASLDMYNEAIDTHALLEKVQKHGK